MLELPSIQSFRERAGRFSGETLKKDLTAAADVTLMTVPQGIAYALMAGLPPVTGLYAAAWPAIAGSLTRSSSFVSTGPTNSLSLLVGSAVLAAPPGSDPLQTAMLLALMVGVFQATAGLLRLGALVDYISRAVVLGYITGAATLIAVGQLENVTATPLPPMDPFSLLAAWVRALPTAHLASVMFAGMAVAGILGLRSARPTWPGASIVLMVATATSWLFDLPNLGISVASDIAPIPLGLPPSGGPAVTFGQLRALAAPAMAVTVLSLVEGSSVARNLGSITGERVDMSREFVGSGISNVVAAFTGAYPVSGSLTRSMLNLRSGAQTRAAGVFAGVFLLVVLALFAPVVNYTPVAVLAGLLLVIAWDLVDWTAIRHVMGALWGDRLAFLGTLLGTWAFELDDAIYFGVLISIVLFLRRSRALRVSELVLVDGHVQESVRDDEERAVEGTHCAGIRVLHVEGNLFFGAANELQDTLDAAAAEPGVRVVVVRLKRARGMDYTCAGILTATHERLAREGRHLVLVGMLPPTMALFERIGLTGVFSPDELYPTEKGWFVAMDRALRHAISLLPADHEPDCPLAAYLATRPIVEEPPAPASRPEVLQPR